MRYLHQSIHRWLALGLLSLILGSSASAQGIAVQLDGRNLYFDQPPASVDGRLLVPLRGIFEALSADVLYDAGNRSIKATKGSTVVQLQLGSQAASINGRPVYLDVPAGTVGGRTMVPLRFVSEALGADVKWNGASRTVVINSVGDVAVGDDLSTLPSVSQPPLTAPAADAPQISRVVHNGAGALRPGDNLEVVVYGDPGARATFELLGQTQEINMPEVSSGRYQATYTIPMGIQAQRAVLLAHLRSNGLETAQESERPITIRAQAYNDNNYTNYNYNNNPNYNPGYPTGQLYVSNLTNGSVVPPMFNVQGTAQPGQQVTAMVEYTPNNIVEIITGQTRQFTRNAVADGNGNFFIPVDVSSIRSRQTFRVSVSDGYGPAQVFNLSRQ